MKYLKKLKLTNYAVCMRNNNLNLFHILILTKLIIINKSDLSLFFLRLFRVQHEVGRARLIIILYVRFLH